MRLILKDQKTAKSILILAFLILMNDARARADEPPLIGTASLICTDIIKEHLRVQVSDEFEITPTIAAAIWRFDHNFLNNPTLNKLTYSEQTECIRRSQKVFTKLLQQIKKRLLFLLQEKHDLDSYYREFQVFLRPWSLAERTSIVQNKLFRDVQVEYANLLYLKLIDAIKNLSDPRWLGFVDIKIDLVAWSHQWTLKLGRNETAAVEFTQRKIALQSTAFDPDTMMIFLFHEIAHLSDPAIGTEGLTRNDLRNAERYAWQQTFAFLEARAAAGFPIPPHFRFQVFPMIKTLGFENWLNGILYSRGW